MSSKRVWEVKGRYQIGDHVSWGDPILYSTLWAAWGDVEYSQKAGYSSSLRSYVVPA